MPIGSSTLRIACAFIKMPIYAYLSLPGTHQCESRIPATPAAAFQVRRSLEYTKLVSSN
jgi:hypothetical protein